MRKHTHASSLSVTEISTNLLDFIRLYFIYFGEYTYPKINQLADNIPLRCIDLIIL